VHRHGAPEIINSDQGTQFTGHEYIDAVKSDQRQLFFRFNDNYFSRWFRF